MFLWLCPVESCALPSGSAGEGSWTGLILVQIVENMEPTIEVAVEWVRFLNDIDPRILVLCWFEDDVPDSVVAAPLKISSSSSNLVEWQQQLVARETYL